jgi:hypothetical protein
LICIVTTAACRPGGPFELEPWPPVDAVCDGAATRWSTPVTLPTVTPAIRTGEFGAMFCEVEKTALIV